MFDLISVGDSTIDTFIQIHDAEVKCTLHKEECQLCVEYGDKIPVDHLEHQVAGNATNSAVGGSRLGLKSALYVNVGGDDAGRLITKKLKEEKVDTRYLVVNKEMDSNYSAVLNFKGERTIFVYHQHWNYKLPELDKSRWVYYTSAAPSFLDSKLNEQLVRYLQYSGAKLLYNPGTYQLNAGVKKTPQLLSLTEVFIVNIEEAKKVLGIKETEDTPVKKLLKELMNLGPRQIVITDGGAGSYGYDGEKYYKLAVFPAKLVEMTGSGDSFAIGLLAGLFHGKELKEAMRWGAANGASVVEHIGPEPGLLTYEKMQTHLKENSKIIAREI